MLGEYCPSGRDFSLNLVVLVLVSGTTSLSQVDVAFTVLNRNVVDLKLMCRFSSSPLFSTCSSSDPDFHFHQLIPVAFVVINVVLAHMSTLLMK